MATRRNEPPVGENPPPVASPYDDPEIEAASPYDSADQRGIRDADEVGVDDPGAEPAGTDDDSDALVDQNRQDLERLRAAQRRKVFKVIAGVVAVALLVTFGMQNARPVDVRLLAWTVGVDLVWVVVIAAALGSVLGYLVGRPPKNLRLHEPARRRDDRPRR